MATLLVVEDNLAHQCILSHFSKMYGYSVHFVLSGEEALEVLAAANFTAILMDLSLPGMSGLDCVKQIRQRERQQGRDKTPVIALTADPEQETACCKAEMDAFFTKPFAPEELGKTLSAWMPREVRPSVRLLPSEAVDYIERERHKSA